MVKVQPTHWRVLVALWTFALGVALSYRPPEMAKVEMPEVTAQNGPLVRIGGTAALGGEGQISGRCVQQTADGSLVATSTACVPTASATTARLLMARRADLATVTSTNAIRYCTDCGQGALMYKAADGWRELR